MINVLFLCDKKHFDAKMSRVRFHSMAAIEKVCNLKWSGINWPDYDSGKTVQENLISLISKMFSEARFLNSFEYFITKERFFVLSLIRFY